MSQGYGSGQGYGQGSASGVPYAPTSGAPDVPYPPAGSGAPAGGGFGAPSPAQPGWGPAPMQTTDPQRARSVDKIGLGMLITGGIVLLLRLVNRVIHLIFLISAGDALVHEPEDVSPGMVVAGVGGIIMLILMIIGLLVVIANTVLSIIAAVQGGGKARGAGIVSAVLPLAGLILGWVLALIVAIIAAAATRGHLQPLWPQYINVGTETLISVLVGGGMILCALTVRKWARSQS